MTLARRGGDTDRDKSAKKPCVCHVLYDRVGLKRCMHLIRCALERPMPQLSHTRCLNNFEPFLTFLHNHKVEKKCQKRLISS